MLPWSADLAGRIDESVITSELLAGNPLGDPATGRSWSTCRLATTTSPPGATPPSM